MQKIKRGDTVQIIAGNDIGLRGEVKEVKRSWLMNRFRQRVKRSPSEDRVVVAGINVAKKHQRPTGQTRQAGIIDVEIPVHVSNVMLVCPSCDEPTRVGARFDEDGRKHRYCKRCEVNID